MKIYNLQEAQGAWRCSPEISGPIIWMCVTLRISLTTLKLLSKTDPCLICYNILMYRLQVVYHVCKILKLRQLRFGRRFWKLITDFGLCWTLTPRCGPHLWPQGFHLNKSEYTPLVCKILKLWYLWFGRSRFFKMYLKLPLFAAFWGPHAPPFEQIWMAIPPLILPTKFGWSWPSNFWEEVVERKSLRMDGRTKYGDGFQ